MSKQNRRDFIAKATIFGTGLIVAPSDITKKKKMLLHHVFFWLKNPTSKTDRDQLISGLQTLKKIKTVRKIHIGVPAATEDRAVVVSSYSVSELLFFDGVEEQKDYQDDPIHQQFIKDCGHLWEKVVVYDSIDV
jgi:hypothetical protein